MSTWRVPWHTMRSMPPRLPDILRLNPDMLTRLSSLLLGAAWALVLVGAVSSFLSLLSTHFLIALFAGMVGMLPGLLLVLLLEYLLLQSQKLDEMRRQTVVLKKMLKCCEEAALQKDC